MPNIYYLNTPPHPFWDFVAGIEDHPFFAQHRRPGPPPQSARPGAEQSRAQAQAQAQASTTASDNAKGKQPQANVEDPPEVDPSSVRPDRKDMPFRGRGRFANAFDDNGNKEKHDGDNDGDDCHRGKRGCHGYRRGHENGPWGHRGGPPFGTPPFMFGPNFPFGPHGPFGRPGGRGQEEQEGEREGPGHGHGPHHGFRGRGGPHRGRFGHHPHGGPHSRSPPRGGPFARDPSGFDLPSFLTNLGERLGVDLTSAAEGLGLGLGQKHPRSADSDFEPRTDIFDTPQEYTVHVSLPGAKKSDIGVDWDGDRSVLRIAGVVHRPGVDEEMMARLVVDGRKRETGVFEKTIRLGTPREPAVVDVEAISAKMVDGVLVVRVPKTEKRFTKKQVRVGSASPDASAERHEETYMDAYMNEKEHEKDLLFDADEDMYDGAPEQHSVRETVPAEAEVDAKGKGKQREAEEDTTRERDDRSETIGLEYPHTNAETLPRYEIEEPTESKLAKKGHNPSQSPAEHEEDDHMSDWEKDGSDAGAGAKDADEDEAEDEGEYEYVKINVD
ncbi:hypothetical protein PV04_02235 [Phialophora macrospora]|uniref:SHSP domain-containing protein n=1 Tax=Phialophora macrospora TaxID=1851006 RepID=A0A0D2FTS3_9EURO|nr:hypothetical protein PV04_02235 [Phialophora macrospora]